MSAVDALSVFTKKVVDEEGRLKFDLFDDMWKSAGLFESNADHILEMLLAIPGMRDDEKEACTMYMKQDAIVVCGPEHMKFFAKVGWLNAIKWARLNNGDWSGMTCACATIYEHMHVLTWAVENGCPIDKRACNFAADSGHIHILAWLKEHGLELDSDVACWAAQSGHLEVIKWLRENGVVVNPNACYNASIGGHLDVLKWLDENDIMFKDYRKDLMVTLAAKNGRINCLEWFRSKKFELDKYTCRDAYYSGQHATLKWLINRGVPCEEMIAKLADLSDTKQLACES
jgi:ankyrin repeat protein